MLKAFVCLQIAVCIGVPLAAGLGIGVSIRDDVKGWYAFPCATRSAV